MTFTAVVGSNVFFGRQKLSLVLDFAAAGFFRPVWSDRITEDFIQKSKRPEKARLLIDRANRTFEEAQQPAARYEAMLDDISFPDPDDQHVIELATGMEADAIISDDKHGFSAVLLERYGLECLTTDQFLVLQLDLRYGAEDVVRSYLARLQRREAVTEEQFLDLIADKGLPEFGKALRSHWLDLA